MLIYHLSRIGGADFEEYADFIIVASSEEEARKFAHEEDDWLRKFKKKSDWLNPEDSTCRVIGKALPEMVSGVVVGVCNYG